MRHRTSPRIIPTLISDTSIIIRGGREGEQWLTHTHLNSQTKAARCQQMSQTARSERTNEYKHEPHTSPVLRAHDDQLQWIRGTVFLKKSHSMEQTLKASCTSSPWCSRGFHYPIHRVICITNAAILRAAPPRFPNSFIPVRSKNFL
jgi:hypothetical protein